MTECKGRKQKILNSLLEAYKVLPTQLLVALAVFLLERYVHLQKIIHYDVLCII